MASYKTAFTHLKYPAIAPALSHPPASMISNSDFPSESNFCAPPTRNECPESGLPSLQIIPCRRLSMRDIELTLSPSIPT